MWQIAAATGWSVKYILWGVNYQALRMMLADAPHYENENNNNTSGKGKHKSLSGFFQSRLKE